MGRKKGRRHSPTGTTRRKRKRDKLSHGREEGQKALTNKDNTGENQETKAKANSLHGGDNVSPFSTMIGKTENFQEIATGDRDGNGLKLGEVHRHRTRHSFKKLLNIIKKTR